MATFVNFLRLTELSTGEGSGTWGTTTNQSLELIGESLGYATQQAFSSDADATTTVADGVSDPARAMYFKVTSAGSLSATRTLTIAPNTISRVMFIENATTGSQSIAISQGSGANVTILTGKTAVVYLDGAGSGAAVVDAMAGVDPGVTDTLTEVLVAGNTSGGTNIELSTTDKVQFRDAAIYINSSVDGQLDIVADTEIQIAATTVDINGAVDMASTLAVGGNITQSDGDYLYTGGGNFDIKHTSAGQNIVFSTTPSGGSTAEVLRITSDGNLAKITGDLTLDVAGDIILDADGADFKFRDSGAGFFTISNSSLDTVLKVEQSDEDFIIKGNDGGSEITALTLDMSNAGRAFFNVGASFSGDVAMGDSNKTKYGAGEDLIVYSDGTNGEIEAPNGNLTLDVAGDIILDADGGDVFLRDAGSEFGRFQGSSQDLLIRNDTQDKDISIVGNDGGSTITALAFDMSEAGAATFNSTIAATSATFTTADNTTQLQLISTDADNNIGPVLDLWRNSASPADGDDIGRIYFYGENDASQKIEYVMMRSSISDVTDATEDSQFQIYTYVAGSQADRLHINPNETIFNESSKDVDFRVESNNNANMLFVDGGNNRVGIGTNFPSYEFVVSKDGSSGIEFGPEGINSTTSFIQFYNRSTAAYDTARFYGNNYEWYLGAATTGMALSTSSLVVNESGADSDFRVESDTNANMLFVDGENDRVGIGTATQYDGTALVSALTLSSASGGAVLEAHRTSGSLFEIGMTTSGGTNITSSGSAGYIALNLGTSAGSSDQFLKAFSSTRVGYFLSAVSPVGKIANPSGLAMADDATLVLHTGGTLGGAFVHCYDQGSGDAAIFMASYKGSTTIIADPLGLFSNADTDGKFCLFKTTAAPSGNGHTVTFKNRTGSSKTMAFFMTGANL